MHLSASSTMLLFGLLGAVQAHTVIKEASINQRRLGEEKCLRKPPDNNPVVVGRSPEMVCGFNGAQGVSETCPVKRGDTVTLRYYHEPTAEFPELYLADSHKGPCSIMMKKVDSAQGDDGAGDGWFQIAFNGYNAQTQKWCTARVIDEGFLDFVVPQDLAPGEYLIRSELLGYHETRAPQFYVGCMQVSVQAPVEGESSSSVEPSGTVSIPDAYPDPNHKAWTWDIWSGADSPETYQGFDVPTYGGGSSNDANANFPYPPSGTSGGSTGGSGGTGGTTTAGTTTAGTTTAGTTAA